MIGKEKNILIAGVFGNAVEWYDFTVYAFFVPIIAALFFPSSNALASLLKTFGVFAIGFLVRPIGALFFGYLGDHWGRKKALILSIMMMSVPTLLLGLLPSYEHIGIFAPVLLMMLRIIQGLAVSGELTTASSFLIEHASNDRRGLAGSLAMCSAFAGMVLSSAIASITSELVSDADLYSWGWRIPFLLGGVLGAVGLIVRLKTVDPEVYQQSINKLKNKPAPSLWEHIRSLRLKWVIIGILLTSLMAICNYLLIGYFNTFLIKTEGLPLREVMIINLISLTILTILMPIAGRVSDSIGRKKVLGSGIFGFIILAYPAFWCMTQKSIPYALLGQVLFILPLAPLAGLIPTILGELFNTYNRNTGLSVSYNLSLAIFGGTAPLVAISLVALTGNVFAPACYIVGAALLAAGALVFIPEMYNKPLN